MHIPLFEKKGKVKGKSLANFNYPCISFDNLVIKQCNSENMAKQTLETYQQIIKESSSKTY